jgi:hypothetical protein
MDLDKQLGELIAQAVNLYGGRYRGDWTIGSVRVGDRPETILDRDRALIQVHVTQMALHDENIAVYQLAHEAVHCVIASGRRDTIYFEEGLATQHALTLSKLPTKFRGRALSELPAFFKPPLFAFRALGPPKGDAIRKLRTECPDFDKLDESVLQRVIGASSQAAKNACKRLPESRPRRM